MLRFEVVFRRVLVALCGVFLLQETNLGSLFVGPECVETCTDDVAPGHCSPVCVTCACGTHAKPVAARATRLPAPSVSKGPTFAVAVLAIGDLHLPDILHVPKPFVA